MPIWLQFKQKTKTKSFFLLVLYFWAIYSWGINGCRPLKSLCLHSIKKYFQSRYFKDFFTEQTWCHPWFVGVRNILISRKGGSGEPPKVWPFLGFFNILILNKKRPNFEGLSWPPLTRYQYNSNANKSRMTSSLFSEKIFKISPLEVFF